ncbi:uncharacterized protein SPSK_00192 [Sporothrix schenckii 1099-18]|uniref:Uncharacterized protein n=1 Tax=Sporothrix schenckii 1099-18 TaxID=1397361 RepID=A0A0F2M3T7_SPOSC|nr:uncharacterized protein SPSK_00192 [Sporothrix schenckii 1099-18]KJR83739.1 hypothetical protein SPSK_00192 [Sporothrix schenckii 1099-18]
MLRRRRRLGPASPVRRDGRLCGESQFAGVGARQSDRADSGEAVLLWMDGGSGQRGTMEMQSDDERERGEKRAESVG